jgi:general stress protein 26
MPGHPAADPVETERFWRDLLAFDVCMLVTRDGAYMRSRPMKPFFRPSSGRIFFLISERAHTLEEIKGEPSANLVFADDANKVWISVSGFTAISSAPEELDELWGAEVEPWFPSGKAEAVALAVTPEIAEYWTYPESRMRGRWELLKAELTGAVPETGVHRKVAL